MFSFGSESLCTHCADVKVKHLLMMGALVDGRVRKEDLRCLKPHARPVNGQCSKMESSLRPRKLYLHRLFPFLTFPLPASPGDSIE